MRWPASTVRSCARAETAAAKVLHVRIRSELPADAPQIEALTAAAFLNAPHRTHTEHYIVNALRKAGQLSVSLVAEADGALIGHIAISPVAISSGETGWFGLAPLAVLPQHQLQGIGSQLVREALRVLRERGASGCVVLGEPRYYGRFGFSAHRNLVLPGAPGRYFQAIAFNSAVPRGTVSFHEAFEARS